MMTPTTQPPAVPAAGRDAHRRVLAVSCLALATVVSAVASLNVALPDIARSTHASQTQLSWIIDAYALVFAALLLPAGALGDRFGRRRALLTGLAVFGFGSIAAMTVSGANMLIGLRGLLGIGAALVMPATLSTITSTFPRDQRSRAVAVWAGVAGGSAVLGLLASGLVLELWSWRSVFGLNILLAALAIAGTLWVIPESAERNSPRLDTVGALIAAAGLGAVVYFIIEAPEAGWFTARTIGGLAGGLLALAVFVRWELARPNPLLDPRLFRQAAFAAGTVSITVQFFAFFGFVFLILQYLQLVRGDSPLVAAVSLVPMAAAMMPCARLAPHIATRTSARTVCVAGLALMTAALVTLSRVDATSSYLLLLCGLVPLGAGMGLAMTPATTALTDALPSSKQGIASAVNDLARELGGALGIAVLGSLLHATYRNNLHGHLTGLPEPVAEHARSSLALAQRIGGPVAEHAETAFVAGMRGALLGAAITVAVAGLALLLLMRPAGSRTAPSAGITAHQPDLPDLDDSAERI